MRFHVLIKKLEQSLTKPLLALLGLKLYWDFFLKQFSSGWTGTFSVDQAGPELKRSICLCLPSADIRGCLTLPDLTKCTV